MKHNKSLSNFLCKIFPGPSVETTEDTESEPKSVFQKNLAKQKEGEEKDLRTEAEERYLQGKMIYIPVCLHPSIFVFALQIVCKNYKRLSVPILVR